MDSTNNEVTNEVIVDKVEDISTFAGWGTTQKIEDLGPEHVKVTHLDSGLVHKLGEWKSTAICGNDITSSCLYVSALCAIYAGPYAPIALACVAVVLYLFRNIYAEVGLALPLNGGAYNVLLNTTTKAKASIAACLTLLSYLATAVISANEAMHYAHNLWHGLNVFWATIILLGIFAILNLIGISESAIVALFLFIFHIFTLVLLSLCVSVLLFKDLSIFWSNWQTPTPNGILKAIFFGFSAAMLGISGFESSANFIEEQQEGVFPKTLRNMWIAVAIFNPLISLLSLGILPLSEIANHKEDLLAQMGLLSAGRWLQVWVSINAVLVLSGAVLTSYVGVTGLIRRMALDRCLPQFLLKENKWRNTNHWIILLFFALCCSVLVITGGRIETLAGVYTLSFLCVMALFAVGNMLLKIKRDRLPREIRASWGAVIIAFIAVIVGLIGNLLINPAYVRVFLIYFGVAFLVVEIMFLRVQILKAILAISQMMIEKVNYLNQKIASNIISGISQINNQTVIFFSRGDSLRTLNQAALYVLQNEQSKRLVVLHCYNTEEEIPKELTEQLDTVDKIYPELRIDLILIKGRFGPELIEKVSQRLKVPKNYMFIGTPSDRFPHNIAQLGGVRLIM
ncbi:MAG: APC family permease [Blastocatellia bacterium]